MGLDLTELLFVGIFVGIALHMVVTWLNGVNTNPGYVITRADIMAGISSTIVAVVTALSVALGGSVTIPTGSTIFVTIAIAIGAGYGLNSVMDTLAGNTNSQAVRRMKPAVAPPKATP